MAKDKYGLGKLKRHTVASAQGGRQSTKPKKFIVHHGTRNTMTTVDAKDDGRRSKRYAGMGEAQNFAILDLKAHRMWCERHNNAGVPIINRSIEDVNAVTEARLLDGPIEVLCEFDDHTGIHARYVFELDRALNALGPTTTRRK